MLDLNNIINFAVGSFKLLVELLSIMFLLLGVSSVFNALKTTGISALILDDLDSILFFWSGVALRIKRHFSVLIKTKKRKVDYPTKQKPDAIKYRGQRYNDQMLRGWAEYLIEESDRDTEGILGGVSRLSYLETTRVSQEKLQLKKWSAENEIDRVKARKTYWYELN